MTKWVLVTFVSIVFATAPALADENRIQMDDGAGATEDSLLYQDPSTDAIELTADNWAKLHLLAGNGDALIKLFTGEDYWSLQHDLSASNDFLLRYDGSTKMTVDTDGDVEVAGDMTILGTDIKDANGYGRIGVIPGGNLTLKDSTGASSITVDTSGHVTVGSLYSDSVHADDRFIGDHFCNQNSGSGGRDDYGLYINGDKGFINGSFYVVSGGGDGRVGIGTTSPDYQLEVTGSYAAKASGEHWTVTSDERLKRNVRPLTGALDQIALLNPVEYEWINPHEHGDVTWTVAGFLAQEVEQAFPRWVNSQGFPRGDDQELVPEGDHIMAITLPTRFHALVVQSIKELREENEVLRDEVWALRELLCQQHAESPACSL